MDTRGRELVEIGSKLFAGKRRMDDFWQSMADAFYAARADFTATITFGEEFASHRMDSYPEYARETLANSIESTLRNGDWFQIKTGFEEIDEKPENAQWFEAATKRFRRLIYDRRANLTRALTEGDHDYVAFGNAVVSVEESPDRSHFYFRNWHLRDVAWMENEVGKIDHLHRKMKMTARNIVRRWRDKAPREIAEAAERSPMQEFEVRHIVMPVDEYHGSDKEARRLSARGMQFMSLYVCAEHNHELSRSALPVFPYVCPRWRTVSSWQYGFSPAAAIALPDARMLQQVARVIIEGAEKRADPPLVATEEAIRSDLDIFPGGVTWVSEEYDERGGAALRALDLGKDVGIGMEVKQDVRLLISEAFLLNKLFLPSGADMTAFEAQLRNGEYRRAILPFFNPIEAEYHMPLLDTAFAMAVRNQAFDFAEMPEDLDGADITFTFESPLNTAEGRTLVAQFQETLQLSAAAAQIDQGIVAEVDWRKAYKDAVRGTGAPSDWMAEAETVEAADEEASQAAQLAKAAQLASTGAGVAQQIGDGALALQNAGIPLN